MYCVLLGTTIRRRHGHRARARLPFEPFTIHHPLDLYTLFTMPALSQLFLQALPPRIVHYRRCLYTWARPIPIEAGVKLLARGQVLVGDWTTR
jgi:hypothetical protein